MKLKLLYLLHFLLCLSAPLWCAETSAEADIVTIAGVKSWKLPEYPPEAVTRKIRGTARVHFVVQSDGKVGWVKTVHASDPCFSAPAAACVRKWTFTPAMEGDRAIDSAMEVDLRFREEDRAAKSRGVILKTPEPIPLPITAPKVITTIKPKYPEELDARNLPGFVRIRHEINEQGRSEKPEILMATHAAFVPVALAALAEGKFEPARQGPLKRRGTMQQVVDFDSTVDEREACLKANGISAPDGQPWSTLEGGIPAPANIYVPVYPRNLLLAGTTGEALVSFTVGVSGNVTDAKVVSATTPAFGAALLAAVEMWMFTPGTSGGKVLPVRIQAKHAFDAENLVAAEQRIAKALQSPEGIGQARGLDERLQPLWRMIPAYPQELRATGAPTGDAEIEFVIDRDGRVRAPLVIRATHPAFGWSAATAATQWVFAPPRRGGQADDVRVRVPFNFKP
ncbi:MAG: TonB family protein [Opitutae bacterium]|nr:TonB family protein [Opitutae bacterium]